jgi:hypothetical protein
MGLKCTILATAWVLSAACWAQPGPTILQPQKAEPAGPRYEAVRPAPENPDHFVARTKHLLELVRKNPAPDGDPRYGVGGVRFWPASPITAASLRVLDEEGGRANRQLRDRALSCGRPGELPRKAQVVLLETRGSRLSVPVFLTPEGKELQYIELSLDRPGPPVLLVVTGYNALAIRITTSPATRLAAVHLHTYYPNVVLGVEPAKVTQQYNGPGDCRYGFSDSVQSNVVLQQLGRDPDAAVRYKTDGQHQVAIGVPQAVKRAPPVLGNFLDPEMPVPNNYGIVVLASLGYIRPVSLGAGSEPGVVQDGRARRIIHNEALEVLKPFRIPAGLAGGHSVTFLLHLGSPIPSGELAHSSLIRRN